MILVKQPKERSTRSSGTLCFGASSKKVAPVLFLLCLLQLSVAAIGQKITLHLKNSPFKKAIEAIKAQSGYDLVLVQSHLEGTHPVSLNLVNADIKEAMEALTNGQPVSYEIKESVIILQRKEAKPAAVTLAPQQKQPVSGQVKDETGVSLPGVTIQVKGTTTGARTDEKGNFKLDVNKGDILVVSYVGYETQEIAFTGQSALDIRIKSTESALSEVVVVGYGTQKRKSVTGSVASVKMGDVNTSTNTNFTQALAGRAAGVNVVQTTGQPGAGVSVQIRSSASFASGGPLYVVDGVIVNDDAGEPEPNTRYGTSGINRSPLNFLNPNDIENIDVLKDASATAIYGARAAGGVVLITTKKGKAGIPSIQYDVSHSFQKSLKYYDILDTHDYMEQRNKILQEKWMLDNKIAPYGNVDPSTVTPFVPKYTAQQMADQKAYPNAIDAIMQNGFTQQHNISMSGTANKTRYYVSGNYLNQEGVLKHSDYTRYSGKINLDQSIGEKIKVGVNIIATGSKANNGSIGGGVYENSGMIGAAFYYPPTMPFQDADGNYPINPDYQNTPNPLSFLTITDNTKSSRLLTSGYAEWNILPGLTAKGSISYDQSTAKRSSYFPRTFLYGARAEGQAGIYETNATSRLAEYTLNYVKDLGKKSRINALVGHSYQLTDKDGLNAGNDHFPTDNFLYYNLGFGTALRPSVGSYRNSTRIWKSYFARVVYEYDGKYILSASVRRDGASHFAANKKWGAFPGASAAWVISEENFLKPISAISFLKLRVGYGAVGNANIGSSAFTYFDNNSPFVIGGVNLPGVKLSQIANPNLTWETQTEFNVGLDYAFLQNRISGSFDVFARRFTNLLSKVPLATDFPVPNFATNAGTTRSVGWEVNLQTKNLVNPNGLNWSTTINFSHYKNTWVKRSPEALKSLAKYIDPTGNFNAWYGYQSEGIYDPSKMKAPSWMPGILPGEIIIKDVNGYDDSGNLTGKPDGKLSTADMVQIHTNNDPTGNGQPVPNYSFGFSNQFSYKNFDLSIYMYGLIQKKFNSDYSNTSDVYAKLAAFGWNVLSVSKDRWAFDNPNGSFPTGLNTAYGSYASSSDFWVENASFLRCRDITLGYRVPANLLHKQDIIKTLRVYANVQNPFIVTGYKGIDPELQNFYAYPMTRSFTLGASVGF
ncbi:TonB-dependent receptor [Chitinophaga eiseniae]|uniref:TonB-dependent receptor n=1 Tax=Chitinophaga eiseniae TaxID=634771 RepID=A0A847SDH9_9BACT|nr:TonB-dependent receptor [Chitinophaga eiseniae]NLR79861.1 TonB-dependent receptor [Chitinophaga eiseniae]